MTISYKKENTIVIEKYLLIRPASLKYKES